MVETILRAGAYAISALLLIVAYEVLRASVLRGLRLRLERSADGFLRRHRVRIDRFKFLHKHYVRQALLNDPGLHGSALRLAREHGEDIDDVLRRAEGYIEEIVPYFNMVSYYKLGFGVARPLTGMLYDVVTDTAALRAADARLDPSKPIVYVINHRSNADYVLFALAMSREVALSYAVGEWARVWPLEALFKSFGSYFVRRGERDPLYHEVLRRYVQFVTRGGLVQGIFLEGGLSRDGSLRRAKVGLLDALLGGIDPDNPDSDVQFVPVGLNFDRVLEDSFLLREAEGAAAPGPAHKARSFVGVVVTFPWMLVQRMLRAFRGARRLARRLRGRGFGFGVAAVRPGMPVTMRTLLGDSLRATCEAPREQRKEALQRVADALMARIGDAVPATPVPIVAAALLRVSDPGRDALRAEVAALLDTLRAHGTAVVLGPSIDAIERDRRGVEAEAASADSPLWQLERDLVANEAADAVIETALAMLKRRRCLRIDGEAVSIRPEGRALIRYYAASIEHALAAAGAPIPRRENATIPAE